MLTAIWRVRDCREFEWILELFGDAISGEIRDPEGRIFADDCLVIDNFIHRKPLESYVSFRSRTNAFLIHLSDEQYHGGYGSYRFFTGVFRNYWSNVFDERSVLTFPLGYSNGIRKTAECRPAHQRTFNWSFAGEIARGSRPEMAQALQVIGSNNTTWIDTPGVTPLRVDQYRHMLENSVFAPCPMGRINLESFRLYEALECGAIPIVEERWQFDYFRRLLGDHPIPTVRTWHSAVSIMRDYLSAPERLATKQQEIHQWWCDYKYKLNQNILAFLDNRAQQSRHATGLKWHYHLPFWQATELSRHHSLKALARRGRIQASRLAGTQT